MSDACLAPQGTKRRQPVIDFCIPPQGLKTAGGGAPAFLPTDVAGLEVWLDASDASIDSDGDGVGDTSDAFPNDANETTDSDSDGVGDNSDNS